MSCVMISILCAIGGAVIGAGLGILGTVIYGNWRSGKDREEMEALLRKYIPGAGKAEIAAAALAITARLHDPVVITDQLKVSLGEKDEETPPVGTNIFNWKKRRPGDKKRRRKNK